ncbi:hypothetical protein [Rhodopirellula baltica]|uniref:hypothetical protein n=1 Tax=Rhodopirellula baltica TaxID=265606 RepID=UPI0005695D52|nr:hypothetical protein [Rhodopirellula baltica]
MAFVQLEGFCGGLVQVLSGVLVSFQQYCFPKNINVIVLALNVFDSFFKAGDQTAIELKDARKLMPEDFCFGVSVTLDPHFFVNPIELLRNSFQLKGIVNALPSIAVGLFRAALYRSPRFEVVWSTSAVLKWCFQNLARCKPASRFLF